MVSGLHKNFPRVLETSFSPTVNSSMGTKTATLKCESSFKPKSRDQLTWRWYKNGYINLSLLGDDVKERLDMNDGMYDMVIDV